MLESISIHFIPFMGNFDLERYLVILHPFSLLFRSTTNAFPCRQVISLPQVNAV